MKPGRSDIGASFGLRARVAALFMACALLAAPAGAASRGDAFQVVYSAIAHDAIFDIEFNGDLGIAVGGAGLVLTTKDAGATWKRGEALGTLALLGVDVHAGRSLAVGQNGQIFRRVAGSWAQMESGSKERLLAIDSDGGELVVAVGGFGTVLISRDGGVSWTRRTFDWEPIINDFIEPHLYGVDVRGKTITIVGERGLVMRSEDGGASWQKVNQADESLFDLYITDNGLGFAVGQKGAIIATTDGGRSWSRLKAGSQANLLGVWANSLGQVLVSGIRTALYSADRGKSWRTLDAGDIPVSWYQTAAGNRAGAPGFIVGHSGRIINIEGTIKNLVR